MRETEVRIRMCSNYQEMLFEEGGFGCFIRLSRYQFIILAINDLLIFPKFSTILYCDN